MANLKEKNSRKNNTSHNDYQDEKVLDQIAAAIGQLKFGTVTIVVQDSKVVQIDKTEKVRLC
ncbi:MAG: YezD family protein [Bacillota bacterium]|nr:YezD family protein [Bacillota bacterium]